MDIKEIVSNIPNDLSRLIKNIYVINDDDNTLYSINYKGNKTAIGPKKNIKELMIYYRAIKKLLYKYFLIQKENMRLKTMEKTSL